MVNLYDLIRNSKIIYVDGVSYDISDFELEYDVYQWGCKTTGVTLSVDEQDVDLDENDSCWVDCWVGGSDRTMGVCIKFVG